jgi:hypothetical protein
MDLDGLKGSWQSRIEPDERIGKEDVMRTVLTRLDRLERDVRRRDLVEALTGFALMAFFGWLVFVVDSPVARVGAGLIVVGCAFIILWSRRAATRGGRSMQPASDLPIVHFCRRELQFVHAQIRLLRSVWWWYVAPTLLGVELFLYGTGHHGIATAILMVLALLLGIVIHWANRNAATRWLVPLRDDLERCLADLNGVEGLPHTGPHDDHDATNASLSS